ncbi:DUF4430 domain-containing protein [Hazenella sp. IB182357]|uniref:DUF4430 domain-containing protein n=1 Tax=Polycladospora coralii TaxID=2771432 RepID=A0A926RSH8_9BACL|nr:DUF4430 domain-containing protein [Polycladospora coralii]MBD1371235.1 DUF4430 domain-containing protein [Polycladospora coralii]
MKRKLSLLVVIFGFISMGMGIGQAIQVWSPLAWIADTQQAKSIAGEANHREETIQVKPEKERNTTQSKNETPEKGIEINENQSLTEPDRSKSITSVTEEKPPTSTSSTPSTPTTSKSTTQSITLSITGSDGARFLAPAQISLRDGDTVFDALKRATDQNGIQMEYRGAKHTLYVEGIHNLYEFDKGPQSGWMYRVNGVFPNKSAGIFTINNGDRIEWLYTKNLGRDIGAEF